MTLPRGIRNNNPGNIRHSKTAWKGKADEQPDKSFVKFREASYGIRALYKVLCTYQRVHRLMTIKDMIGRWAPPNENDTEAYVTAVALAVGQSPKHPIDIAKDRAVAVKMVAAIIRHENGQQPYSAEEIGAAIDLP